MKTKVNSVLIVVAAAVAATSDPTIAATDNLEEVIVTGTRRSDVTVLNSPIPIDIVSNDALASSGSLSLVQSMRAILPSASFSQTGGVIGSRLAQSISLRGLPAGNTLVLVNGKRRAVSPKISFGNEWSRGQQPVDLNDIPQSAVARVEVLRDGASAQYGSDAIAGVVNVVLRGNEPGGSLSASLGQYYKGDGQTKSVEGWYTAPIGNDGFINFSLAARTGDRTDRDNLDVLTYYFAGDPREATANKNYGFYGNPESEAATLGFNGELPLANGATLYGFGTYSYRESIALYRITPNSNGNVRSRFPDGQMSNPIYRFKNYDFVMGARWGAIADGQFDLSLQNGSGKNESEFKNAQNASYGASSPTNFDLGTYLSDQTILQLDYTRDIPVSYSSGALTLSAGLAYRTEEFGIDAGDPFSYGNGGVLIADGPNAGRPPSPGSTDFAGLRPADAGRYDRNVSSIYLGLEQQFTEKFQAGAAVRFEDFSDFGSATTGKLSMRYDFSEMFALRASVSNAFKAPSMGQVGASSTTSVWVFPATGAPFLAVRGFYPVTSSVAKALGASSLTPEESDNLSVGLVIRPTDNLSLTADWYQIDVSDVILPIDTLLGTAVTTILANNGVRDVTGVGYFANQADTRSQGVDLAARYSVDLADSSRLSFSLAANFNDHEITAIKPNPPQLAGAAVTLVGRQSRGYLTEWAPKDKYVATVRYEWGAFDLNLSTIRYGEYKFFAGNAANDQTFDAQWVTNVSAGYQVNDNVRVTLGANNAFDDYSERPIPANRFRGMNNYDLQAPEGGNGGYYYLTVNFKFE